MNTLRNKLLASLLAAIVLVLTISGFATYRAAQNEIDDLMDYQLRQLALSLQDQQPNQVAPAAALDFVIQIWDSHGVQLYFSQPHSYLPSIARFGYTTVDTPAGQWRVYSIPLGDHVVQTAQPLAVRHRLAAQSARRTLLPILATLPLLALLIWWIVGRELSPLQRLAREIASRQPQALEPIDTQGVPAEITPMLNALNALLGRLGAALASQKAFVADAAHELRTPLTALKIQLQLARRATTPEQRDECLAQLESGIDRASHLVQQLLALARSEPDSATTIAPCDLPAILRQSLADLAPLAGARQITLSADDLPDYTPEAAAEDLRTLFGNLINNAVRYTPEGGRIEVSSSINTTGCIICIDDSGPGIEPAERERVLNRFYRRPGETASGSGLGLAIASNLAQRNGASLSLEDSPLGGLRVRVVFLQKAE